MAGNGNRGHRGQVVRYSLGIAFLLLTVVPVLLGAPWYEMAIMLIPAFMFFLGNGRRIFRAAVNRSEKQIVCRFLPWYEGIVYFGGILVPAIGAASLGFGSQPGNPGWLRYSGILLICVAAVLTAGLLRSWRTSRLCISPSALSVRLPAGLRGGAEIGREQIEAIAPKIDSIGMGMEALRVVIVYRDAETGETNKPITLGPQLTVEPTNLLNGLLAWKDGANDDPSEMLDRVEGILRGRSRTQV